MDASFEKKLVKMIKPLYKKGRAGDWDHILRMVKLCKHLLEHEDGDEDIVLPTAYLHDIGWSAVDFSDSSSACSVSTPSCSTLSPDGSSSFAIALCDKNKNKANKI